MDQESALLATLDSYADAYCAKNIDELMSLFDDGDDISVIGTGEDELCSGRDQIRSLFLRNFDDATANRFEWHWRQPTVRGDTGVVAVLLTIHLEIDGRFVKVPIRWTVTAHHDDKRWVWLHRHASSAALSQDKGTAYPTQ